MALKTYSYSNAAPLPLDHFAAALRYLLHRGDVEFITYDDLRWVDGDDYETGYLLEWAAWREAIASGELSRNRIYLLIQHDTDSGPQESLDMLRVEEEYGIASSTMVHFRWRIRDVWDDLVDYPIDWSELARLAQLGFALGYHCNAFHNTSFQESIVYETFRYEINALRKYFPVHYFSPHGEWTDELGRGNASFNYPQHVECDAKWIHNRFSPKFHGYYSDGGLMGRIRRNDPTVDLMSWLATLQPGQRYRMLIHPQYFSRKTFVPLEGIEAQWYGRVLAAAETGRWI